MITNSVPRIGAVITFAKAISEADVALFTLVTTEQPAPTEAAALASLDETPMTASGPVVVPAALIAAMLAAAALRLLGGWEHARLSRADVTARAPAVSDDTLTATAEVVAADAATGVVRVAAFCVNQAGARVAEGTFELATGATGATDA